MLEYDPQQLPSWILQHESGWSYPLDFDCTVLSIGRTDCRNRWTPGIDLEELDAGRTVSRKHAILLVTREVCMLREQTGARNGTFVNSCRLVPLQAASLHCGDFLRFGNVRLRIVRPSA